jgi:WbqC-like protein family
MVSAAITYKNQQNDRLMEKKIAILQSNYIPWKGYFDIINMVDEFILFDEAQYTKRDWRNRNKIKTPNGASWLSIPVNVKGKFEQSIRETEIHDKHWTQDHWKSLHHNYAKAPYFREYRPFFEELYALAAEETLLSEVNYLFLRNICDLLGIHTRLSWSSDYNLVTGKTDRLIGLCQQVGGKEYLSGPSAKDYLDESLFHNVNMRVAWMDYSGYPEYHQLYPPFDHAVSIVDLIFNEGPNAPKFMKSFPADSQDHT